MMSNILTQCEIDSITLTYLVSGHSHRENDNAHSVIERVTSKTTIYNPAELEAIIKVAFRKNRCFLNVLTHKDVIDFKNESAFLEYRSALQDKTTDRGPNETPKRVIYFDWTTKTKS